MNARNNDTGPRTSRSVHLSASAGSGKTRELTERYRALLGLLDAGGLGIDQAVAITFTDKAAAEIRERVMSGLPEPLLKRIIRGRQDLRISTIHSFCMNILKRYPLEAGLPPDFGVLDERDRSVRVRMAIEEALESSDRDPSAMAPLREFSADSLADLVGALFSVRSRLKRIEIDTGGSGALLDSFRSGLGVDRAADGLDALLAGGEWGSRLAEMESLLRQLGDEYGRSRGKEHLQLSAAREHAPAFRLVSALGGVYFTGEGKPRKNPFIAKKNYRGGDRAAYEESYAAVQDLFVRFRELFGRLQSGRQAMSLLSLFLRAEKMYEAANLREGYLDFDDLEISAYRLLKSADRPEILERLDRKVLHYLVDEFQDTSDIQWAILATLTAEIFAGEGAEKPMPPTLFVVGDEKQSIYRFREANYRLIENVRERMLDALPPGAREVRTLDRNYRSAPAVIETVNLVFASLWGNGYAPSRSDRAGHAGSVRLIEVPSCAGEGWNGPAEAEVLAREIHAFVSGRHTVYEMAGTGWRRREARYDDCAVLIQTRTKLKEYEAALRNKGVPFRVLGGIGFYEEDEVQAVIAALFFLWNRNDRLSLAAALRSGLFGLSDQDILDIFGGEDPLEVLRDRWPGVWDLLHAWSSLAGVAPLADLVHRIVNDSGAYIRFGRGNHQAVFNLDKLIDTAREFDRRGHVTLQDFVEWVKNVRETEQREAAADMNLPGFEGAASIMTVHKAKGLEFPVVFLPGMNQRTRSVTDGPRVLVESDGALRMAFRDGDSPSYREMWEREQQEILREHQRLLYVAMTRARDHLVMIGTLRNGKSPVRENTWMSCVERSLPPAASPAEGRPPSVRCRQHPGWEARTLSGEPAGAQVPLPVPAGRTDGIDPAGVLANIAPVEIPTPLEWKNAAELAAEAREHPDAPIAFPAPGVVPPAVRGNILHRCLEDLTKTGKFDPESAASEFPEVRSLDGDARAGFLNALRSVLTTLTGNREFAWIFERCDGSYSELPFLSRKGNRVISGVIDRLVVKDGKGYVIDYKAIRIENDESARQWKEHYLPQVKAYCEAAKEIFKLASVEGYLLFLDSERLETVVVV